MPARDKKAPPGVWRAKLGGPASPEVKRRIALTKRSKKIKVTLPKVSK
jgi:hypothetical protein